MADFRDILRAISGPVKPDALSRVARFLTSGQVDAAEAELQPGLVQLEDGSVWVVNPDLSLSPAGAQPFMAIPISFDDPQLCVQAFDITAVDQGAQKITVAGDKTTLFPATAKLSIVGSTGNDGAYTVASVAAEGGSTEIVTVEALPDATADGTANNWGTAGIVIPASFYLFDQIQTPTAWDAASDQLFVGEYDITNPPQYNDPFNYFSYYDPPNSVGSWYSYNNLFGNAQALTKPLVVQINSGNLYGAPGSTQGQGTLLVATIP